MGNHNSTPTNFVATVYGNLTPLNNSAFSKARLKIFYKGLNRNGSYITDEVAEKLLATLPGTPIVGYFRGESDDFDGHITPEENKAYGFVPESMNFNWEMSLDPDGVYRTYACTDVVLWTGRYPIASRIVGKSHSMELNPDTIKGEWVETEDYGYVFQFEYAEFFGLCVLGDEFEPCFEGSSFYELNNKTTELKDNLKEMFSLYKQELDTADIQTGGQQMEDDNKDLIAEEELEKDNLPAEGEEVSTKPEEGEEETTNPEADNDSEETETESEESEENQEEEESEDEEESEEEDKEDSEEEENEEESEEEEDEGSEQPDLNSQLAEKDAEIASLKAQLEELNTYKNQKVKEEKEQVIEAYSKKLTEEEVNDFKNRIDEYESAIELKKEIALCILDKEVEEQEESASNFALLNGNKPELHGIEAIVAQYAKK